MKRLLGLLRPVHLYIAIAALAIVIMVITCVRHGKPNTPTKREYTPAKTLSNEVPVDEARQKAIADSLDAINP